MKIYQQTHFCPITITLESEKEAQVFLAISNHTIIRDAIKELYEVDLRRLEDGLVKYYCQSNFSRFEKKLKNDYTKIICYPD